MKKAIICDIDGCLLDTGIIFKEIEAQSLTGNKKWDYFHYWANSDKVSFNVALSEILFNFFNQGFEIILLTARSEKIRNQTRARITSENILAGLNYKYSLYMRQENDFSPSHESKLKHLKELKQKYFIILAIDDDEENCKMFHQNRILTMKAINKETIPA